MAELTRMFLEFPNETARAHVLRQVISAPAMSGATLDNDHVNAFLVHDKRKFLGQLTGLNVKVAAQESVHAVAPVQTQTDRRASEIVGAVRLEIPDTWALLTESDWLKKLAGRNYEYISYDACKRSLFTLFPNAVISIDDDDADDLRRVHVRHDKIADGAYARIRRFDLGALPPTVAEDFHAAMNALDAAADAFESKMNAPQPPLTVEQESAALTHAEEIPPEETPAEVSSESSQAEDSDFGDPVVEESDGDDIVDEIDDGGDYADDDASDYADDDATDDATEAEADTQDDDAPP